MIETLPGSAQNADNRMFSPGGSNGNAQKG